MPEPDPDSSPSTPPPLPVEPAPTVPSEADLEARLKGLTTVLRDQVLANRGRTPQDGPHCGIRLPVREVNRAVISDAIAPLLQPLLVVFCRRFDEIDGRLDAMAAGDAERDRQLDEHDRKLDMLAAQMRLLVGGMGLLVAVLIAVAGFLFTNTN